MTLVHDTMSDQNEITTKMNILKWLTGCLSNRGKSLSLYKRGMAKAKKHDHQGAIDDYNAAIEIPDLPPDVKAMILYNRALVYAASGQEAKSKEDLNAVLAMAETLADIKTEARRRLVRMQRRDNDSNT